MDEIKRERLKWERCEVATDRGSRAWTRRERLDRWTRLHSGKREDAAGAIDDLIVHIHERTDRRARERHGAERGDRSVDITRGQALATEYGHSAGPGERENERAGHDPVGEPHLIKRIDGHDDTSDPLANDRRGTPR